ncbi:hypothetical protein [Paenibacillus spongiae]|uniref:Uncharacterized protein n=1 Tax=Paenibacillus spongiae TaxID=2909671 RepID=A0ABY5S914_9BACL|nr:hypothetical protein [Paenibacillus spongiae]UVI29290.1 hypothetical protein L1F29_28305 [Paenibacillus spongiae]
MATRVYLFLEEEDFKLEAWENAGPEYKRCIDNHRVAVRPGRNLNHADIEVQCDDAGLALKFSLCDIWQEQSSMLASMKQSVVEDVQDKDYDYWDQIPPFGVVELYRIELERREAATEAEVTAFLRLVEHFLSKHFMMYVIRESEIQSIHSYIIDWSNGNLKTFTHDGETGYRVKTYY